MHARLSLRVSQISINVDIHVSICVSRARIYTDGYTLHEIAGVRFVFVLLPRHNIEIKSSFISVKLSKND